MGKDPPPRLTDKMRSGIIPATALGKHWGECSLKSHCEVIANTTQSPKRQYFHHRRRTSYSARAIL